MNSAVPRFLSIAAIGTFLFAGCAPAQTEIQNYGDTTSQPSPTTEMNDKTSFQLAPPAAGDTIAVVETDFGTMKIKLFAEHAPKMTKNFVELANGGNFNGTPFHRVVKDFMIQTGDFTNKNGTGGYSYKGPGTMLPDEIVPELKHLYGTVSMANRGPNTNGSQFFIVTNKNGTSFLDGGYTIFGQVYEGMDVAERIQNLQVPGSEQPGETVNITGITVEAYGS